MGGLFGGSKQTSTSSNLNNSALTSALMPTVGGVGDSFNAIKALLSGDTSGFNTFKNAAGYNFAAKQGTQGVMGSGAARGLLRSGATGKSLISFGQGLANQYLDNYLSKLTGLGQLGLGAAGVLADSGRVSNQTSKSKNGLGGLVGGLASGIAASDPRLKENVIQIGVLEDGLPLYSYNYVWDTEDDRQIGVMADEVAEKRPWALGPKVGDYMTVDYSKLGGAE